MTGVEVPKVDHKAGGGESKNFHNRFIRGGSKFSKIKFIMGESRNIFRFGTTDGYSDMFFSQTSPKLVLKRLMGC